jgi:hypothetical protein
VKGGEFVGILEFIEFVGLTESLGLVYDQKARPLKNAPFCANSVSESNLNPRNTQCIPVVKIFVFLDLAPNRAFFKGLEAQFSSGNKKVFNGIKLKSVSNFLNLALVLDRFT